MAAGLERLLSWNKAQGEKNVCSFQLKIQIIANNRKEKTGGKGWKQPQKKSKLPAKIV